MKSEKNNSFIFYTFFFSVLICNIIIAGNCVSAEGYKFERLWPTLQQPWYFYFPNGIAIDKDGFVYVADTEKHHIQKFTADGQFVSKWGGEGREEGKFISPYGVAADRDGFIYVTDKDNYRIQKFMSDGTFSAKWDIKQDSEEGKLFPSGIAVDSNNFIYVTVANLNKRHIQKFTTNGKFLKRIEYQGIKNGEDFLFFGIAIDQEGFIYVADSENNQIQKFTPEGAPATWKKYENENGKFELPSGIAIDKDGFVYVSGKDTDNVYKFDSNGNFIAKWGNFGSDDGNFISPTGMAVSQNGLIYVVDWNNRRIQKFMADGRFVTAWQSQGSGQGEFRLPEGIAVDQKNGFIYVVDTNNNRIQKFQINGQFADEYPKKENTETFNTPYGVAVDAEGFIYVADTLNNCIKKISRDMQIVHQWGSIGISEGEFNYPLGVAIDKDGFIYVADGKNYRIQKFTSDGKFENAWGSKGNQNGEFERPTGIGIDKNGFVYVTDRDNSCIQKFTSDGQFQDKWETDWPVGIAIDDDFIYVSDSMNHCIKQFDLYGNFITRFSEFGSGAGQLNSPSYLCIVSDGRIYVSDTENNRIQVFKPVDPEAGISKAVIIAGGGPYEGNHLWDATRMNANFAYRTLNYQGFNKNDICYLSSDTQVDLDGDNKADVYGKATVENLRQAVSDISDSSENVKDLLVYLVDHGGEKLFRMNETQTCSVAELKSELEKLVKEISGRVIVIYDACESGTFHSGLRYPSDGKHIVITSTSGKEKAYFMAQGSVSFSNFFWTNIFNGDCVRDAFKQAQKAIGKATESDDAESKQRPRVSPSYNDLTDDILIGTGIKMNWSGPKLDVPAEYSVNGSSADLYASVTDNDGSNIDHVWAIIIPPFGNVSDNSVLEMPSVDLMPDGNTGNYKAVYDKFNIKGTYLLVIHARDGKGNTSVSEPVKVSVGEPMIRRAIIAAGSDVVEKNIKVAYYAFKTQYYTDDAIYLMAPESFLPDVETRLTTRDNLRYALERWSDKTTYDLVVYMTGKGERGKFQINENEMLTAVELDNWLDELQDRIPGMVTVIYDADYSGSFISLLAPPQEKNRILVSGSGTNQKALFSFQNGVSFSTFFWKEVSNGLSVRDAFRNAGNALKPFFSGERRMMPQIDDNGNGVADERSDGKIAGNYTIGAGIRTVGDETLATKTANIVLEDGRTTETIKAENVTTTGTITKIWATVLPPEYTSGKIDTLPPEFNFGLKESEKGIYQKECKKCFSTFGTYQITVYAEDSEGNVSVCKNFSIYQPEGSDVYEEDDISGQAGFIFSDESQEHNFHHNLDDDWVKFYAVEDEFYAVETTAEENCDTFIEIYDTDGKTRLIPKNDKSPGIKNRIEKWKCPETGIYYVKIRQADPEGEDNCEGGRYTLKIYPPTAPITGELHIIVTDYYTGELIDKPAWLTTEDIKMPIDISSTLYDWYIPHRTGIYNVKIDVDGYEITEKTITVKELVTTPVTFELKSLFRHHSADYDHDNKISLPELMRVIQLCNLGNSSGFYHCDSNGIDGYASGDGDRTCIPHHSDYNPQDWRIDPGELSRLTELFHSVSYHSDPSGEDGFEAGRQP